MNVQHEIEHAVRRAREYYTALTGEPAAAIDDKGESPLRAALTAVREASKGREVKDLFGALELLERLGIVPEQTAELLDVKDPRGPVEVAAARAVTWERMRQGMPVVSVHLARLGYVGPSAIRMAAKEGRLAYADAVDGDPRSYLTAESAAEWLYQRQRVLARQTED